MPAITTEAPNQNGQGAVRLRLLKTIQARLKSVSMPPLSVEPPMLASKRHLSRGTLTALTATRILFFLSFSIFWGKPILRNWYSLYKEVIVSALPIKAP